MTRSLFLPLTLNQTSINVPPLSILHEALLKTSSMQESVILNSSDSMGSKNKITPKNKEVCLVSSPWAAQKKNSRGNTTHTLVQNNILRSLLLVTLKVDLLQNITMQPRKEKRD